MGEITHSGEKPPVAESTRNLPNEKRSCQSAQSAHRLRSISLDLVDRWRQILRKLPSAPRRVGLCVLVCPCWKFKSRLVNYFCAIFPLFAVNWSADLEIPPITEPTVSSLFHKLGPILGKINPVRFFANFFSGLLLILFLPVTSSP